MSKLKPVIRQYHWLVTGEITFAIKQEDGTFQQGVMHLNAVLYSLSNVIRVRELAKAQQTIQMQFFQQMKVDEAAMQNLQITNVVIMNMFYCGHLTQDEFNAPPEGTELKEMTTPEKGPDPYTAQL